MSQKANLPAEISNILQNTSVTAIKNWLRFRNLPHSAPNQRQFIKNLTKWIEEDKVAYNQLRTAALV